MKKSLFGYAKTTRALAESYGAKMGGFDIYDDGFKEPQKDGLGNALLPVSAFDPDASGLEIPSPGFPPQHSLILKAKNLQSEYDFFYDAMPRSVWISGTNGKTTTTQMSGHLLEKIGAQIGGNVGIPLAALDANARLWILETSSFTLHYTRVAKPEIYALLPITPDHLSWHGSFEKYEEAKLSVLQRMDANALALVPQKYASYPSKAKLIAYESESDLAQKMGFTLSKIALKPPFLLDALMALSVEKIVLGSASYELLNDFVMEENKLEEFLDSMGRLWVNDTKATNEAAVLEALKRYADKKIHLIIGGDDKGVDLSGLFAFMQKLDIKIYAIGLGSEKMMAYAAKFGIEAQKCEFLSRAVESIAAILKRDEVALLSPACASLDQFLSYAERGRVFKEEVFNQTK
ncbi:UDP-N-acetylmuramoyl-L-alanine--D-glutamate ligase [Campylobacter sp.]|uniref:UDP-N-acetylmuramoyl-L-alanine--D-glutamate ligase n=1 Tax=Campylobacter sp. TaxID=205 RepID=UPI0026DC2910|nr:UDP-N-acetylmuramoyl-L-alanine--D-glutamate ligase [Campylobacter sp.]MDO4674879.1 UDP-N-acetylmuramoyl-L-alanine--D-glutamate ligase [Campylobacter sp.]